MGIKIPQIPTINSNISNISKVNINIPKINIPTGIVSPKTPLFKEMDKGYTIGYHDGYSGSSNLSEEKDTVNNDYWLGYSCGYRDGKFDRENGRSATC